MYSTATKLDAGDAIGLGLIRELAAAEDAVPMVGIGGIHAANASDVVMAGADGVAVVSAITRSIEPRQATARLLQLVDEARNGS
ncbi:Thiamine-phosphate synthase [compost metagenome]